MTHAHRGVNIARSCRAGSSLVDSYRTVAFSLNAANLLPLTMSRWVVCSLLSLAALVGLSGCGDTGETVAAADQQLVQRLDFRSQRSMLDVIEFESAAYESVATCMKEQGFEYVPYLYTRELERLPVIIAASSDPQTFAETYGYGVTDPDPFASIDVQTFTPIDQDYDRALYGFTTDEMVANNLRPEGCWGDEIKPIVEASKTFEEARQDLVARIDATLEIADATREWSRCMAELGYNFESRQAAIADFRDRNQRIMMSSGPGADLDRSDFEELLAEEIATAVADHTVCNGDDLRVMRNELATTLGLAEEAQTALGFLAADDAAAE